MARTKKGALPRAGDLPMKAKTGFSAIVEKMGTRIDMNYLAEQVLKEAGGEDELAKMLVGTVKSDSSSSGAKAGTMRLIVDILHQKMDDVDIGEVPPADRLEAIFNFWMADHKKKLERELEAKYGGRAKTCAECAKREAGIQSGGSGDPEDRFGDNADPRAEADNELPVRAGADGLRAGDGGEPKAVRADAGPVLVS